MLHLRYKFRWSGIDHLKDVMYSLLNLHFHPFHFKLKEPLASGSLHPRHSHIFQWKTIDSKSAFFFSDKNAKNISGIYQYDINRARGKEPIIILYINSLYCEYECQFSYCELSRIYYFHKVFVRVMRNTQMWHITINVTILVKNICINEYKET